MLDDLSGVRLAVLLLLPVPLVYLALEKHIQALFPDSGGEDAAHGRDYYLGYLIGRESMKAAEDVDDVLRLLRKESYHFQLVRDDGGEKVFLARTLPPAKGPAHELEAGLLSGALHRATRVRFDVEEERCAARGEGYCKFVAIRG